MTKKNHESSVLTYSSSEAIGAREDLFQMMKDYKSTDEEKERSLGLFLRGALLARIFATAEIYKMILDKPGVIFDVGTWRGQTAVLCENFRAIFEPLHFNRRVIAFDTFEGYKGFSDKDSPTDLHGEGTYSLEGEAYADFLTNLLRTHEKCNAMGHYHDKHSVIQGDCRLEIPRFLEKNPNEIVSLAFLDVNSYEVTLEAVQSIWERLVPGGVIAFWQLTRPSVPAEGEVYAHNLLNNLNHSIKRSELYPGLCYLVKK